MVCLKPIFNSDASFFSDREKTRDFRFEIDARVGGVHSQRESRASDVMQENKQ